ncbi:lysostaphin resistance A-like protein [Planctomycetota bacterium]
MHELFANAMQLIFANAKPTTPLALSILFIGLLISCVACWVVTGERLRQGSPLVAWEARSTVPWNLIDVACVIFLHLAAIVGGAALYGAVSGVSFDSIDDGADISVRQQIAMMMLVECTMLGAVALSVGHLMYRARAKAADLGFSMAQLQQDITLGVLAFLMLTAPVLAIQAGLGALFPDAGQHPFIDLFREQGDNFTIGMIFIVAVLLAPPIEEFLFRVVIQGWLERFMAIQIANNNPSPTESAADAIPMEPTDSDTDTNIDCEANPYSSLALETRHFNPLISRAEVAEQSPPNVVQSWLPIVVASLLFSLAHFGQGTAPIPLFFLSLGLGFIYQRTHRIWPSVVTHMLVNGLAVVQLKIALDSGMQM